MVWLSIEIIFLSRVRHEAFLPQCGLIINVRCRQRHQTKLSMAIVCLLINTVSSLVI
jgi:hypothetical protein